jgi:hypothetical protein
MSVKAMRLISGLINDFNRDWEKDESFQHELFYELMQGLGLAGALGSFGECQAMEEELKKLLKTPAGQQKLSEIIARVVKNRRMREMKRGLKRTMEREVAREASIAGVV